MRPSMGGGGYGRGPAITIILQVRDMHQTYLPTRLGY
eukprot:COSAG05_NODE_1028_length_6112_cov_11.983868_2_plen_37_part_00